MGIENIPHNVRMVTTSLPKTETLELDLNERWGKHHDLRWWLVPLCYGILQPNPSFPKRKNMQCKPVESETEKETQEKDGFIWAVIDFIEHYYMHVWDDKLCLPLFLYPSPQHTPEDPRLRTGQSEQ